jgi:two-component system, OmpR family, sensor kinase
LDNAIKYAPQGEIVVVAGIEKQRVWIRVMDQGPGVVEAELPMIFDRFYRAGSVSDSQSVYGYGLGLSIARRLMEAMQGSIQAENRKGRGACFTCWLPLVVEKGEEYAEDIGH